MSFVLSVLPLSTMTSFHPPGGESSLQYAFKTSGIVRAPLKVAIRTVSIRSCTHSQAVSTTKEGFQLHRPSLRKARLVVINESRVQSSVFTNASGGNLTSEDDSAFGVGAHT